MRIAALAPSLMLCTSFFAQASVLEEVSVRAAGQGQRYILSFDQTPGTYYASRKEGRFSIEFHGTTLTPECASWLRADPAGPKALPLLSPAPVLIMSFPAGENDQAETLPFDNLLVVDIRAEGHEKLWEKRFFPEGSGPFFGPEKISIYRSGGGEEMILSLSPSTENTLVRSGRKYLYVEAFGPGRAIPAGEFEPESAFLKKAAVAGRMTDASGEQGVLMLDFEVRKNTAVTYEFRDRTLRIRMEKE
jgi:hypothetical protein